MSINQTAFRRLTAYETELVRRAFLGYQDPYAYEPRDEHGLDVLDRLGHDPYELEDPTGGGELMPLRLTRYAGFRPGDDDPFASYGVAFEYENDADTNRVIEAELARAEALRRERGRRAKHAVEISAYRKRAASAKRRTSAKPTAAVRPRASERTLECRGCQGSFTAPIQPGRPPSYCPACKAAGTKATYTPDAYQRKLAVNRARNHPDPVHGVGTCRLCGDSFALRGDGLVRRHGACSAAPPREEAVVEVIAPPPPAPTHPRAGEHVRCKGCGFAFPLDHDGYLPAHPHARGVPYVLQPETRRHASAPVAVTESPDYTQLVRRARGAR